MFGFPREGTLIATWRYYTAGSFMAGYSVYFSPLCNADFFFHVSHYADFTEAYSSNVDEFLFVWLVGWLVGWGLLLLLLLLFYLQNVLTYSLKS